jgi:hypothetical protein
VSLVCLLCCPLLTASKRGNSPYIWIRSYLSHSNSRMSHQPAFNNNNNNILLTNQNSQSQSYLTTDGQSANLSRCQATIRASDQIFFLFEIFFRQLRVCYFVTPYLTRGRVCNLLLLLVLASAVPLGSESRGTQTIFFVPKFWDSSNLEGQVPVFISPRNRMAQLYPRALIKKLKFI